MLLSRKIELDYGHTLPNHYSFCNQIHGHRATVIVTIEGEIIQTEGNSSQGMVVDFKFLKEEMMNRIHRVLDHGFAVWYKDDLDREFIEKRNKKVLITTEPPTAEYLAKWSYFQMKNVAYPNGVVLKSVQWYETPNSWAEYSE